eukprot:2272746-Alexandrium_andersonii.AAC.1
MAAQAQARRPARRAPGAGHSGTTPWRPPPLHTGEGGGPKATPTPPHRSGWGCLQPALTKPLEQHQ